MIQSANLFCNKRIGAIDSKHEQKFAGLGKRIINIYDIDTRDHTNNYGRHRKFANRSYN